MPAERTPASLLTGSQDSSAASGTKTDVVTHSRLGEMLDVTLSFCKMFNTNKVSCCCGFLNWFELVQLIKNSKLTLSHEVQYGNEVEEDAQYFYLF